MTILERIAQQRAGEVLHHSVSLAIEKIAEEAARDILSDPAFRAELKAIARHSLGLAVRDLRRNGHTKRRRRK